MFHSSYNVHTLAYLAILGQEVNRHLDMAGAYCADGNTYMARVALEVYRDLDADRDEVFAGYQADAAAAHALGPAALWAA